MNFKQYRFTYLRGLAFIVVFLIGCSSSEHNKDAAKVAAKDSAAVAKDEIEKLAQAEMNYYQRQNDFLTQLLAVKWIDERTIEFSLSVKNIKQNCEQKLLGKAIDTNRSDNFESDDDENGDAYVVSEYFYEKNDCYLRIRIDAEDRSKARVKGSCPPCGPVESIGILRRVKNLQGRANE